jgi:amidase
MTEMPFDPYVSMTELADRIKAGEVSPTAALDRYLSMIDERDEEINAYVTITDEIAREQAEAAEEALENGEDLGPLHGVPVALKDLRDMKQGVPHSFGSALVGSIGFVAPRTTAVVERLEDAGAIILGKTNTPEFGHKGVTDNEYVGATASPLDTTANAGGSSGGSAAAVAAGMTPVATGSDAGGSLRIPATACGIYGHKPSFGLIPIDTRPSAFGLKTHHSVQGPLARTVEDAAQMLEVMTGYHPRDPASVPVDIDYLDAVDQAVDDLRVAYCPDLDVFPVEEEVEVTVTDAVEDLEAAGATVERVEMNFGLSLEELLDDIETTFSTEYVGLVEVLDAELGVDLRNHPNVVSDSLLQMILTGDEKSVSDVAKTGLTRTKVYDAIQDVFEEYDLLATSTLGTSRMDLETDRGLEWELALTWPFNWTGHPAASVPAGETADGGVAAVQLVGLQYHDDTVLSASAALERERPWVQRLPQESL